MNHKKIPQYRVKLVREKTVRYRSPVSQAFDAAKILHAMLDDSDREKVCVIYLNGRNEPIGCEVVGIGGLSSCGVQPRDILRGAILAASAGFIMGHNHPSGDPKPSDDDIALTHCVRAAAEVVGVPLLDHVIVSPNGRHCSFLERGLLWGVVGPEVRII